MRLDCRSMKAISRLTDSLIGEQVGLVATQVGNAITPVGKGINHHLLPSKGSRQDSV